MKRGKPVASADPIGYKYLTIRNSSNVKITRVPIFGETDKYVMAHCPRWISADSITRQAKISSNVCFFETWEGAKQCLLKDAEDRVERARRQLELARAYEGNVKGLKKQE